MVVSEATRLNSLDLDKNPKDMRVVVAMSGGVDSSVVAALLKRDGYDVIGVTLQLYNSRKASKRKGSCCAGQDVYDARRVCDTINVSHYVFDYEERFRNAVIVPFASSYAAGETPLPCVDCNRTVKFSDLLSVTRQLGADVLATGHYIRSRLYVGDDGKRRRIMCRPMDLERDQSYFLFATTQQQLCDLRFPLGDMKKESVRDLAREMGLDIADKSDSQDICFVQQGKYFDVVKRINAGIALEGDIVHLNGQILGRHNGIINYTIGQRRGLGVAMGEPLFVVYLDKNSSRVIVGPRESLEVHRIYLREINWLGDGLFEDAVVDGFKCFVKIRSSQDPVPVFVQRNDDGVYVDFEKSEVGVASGQACVFYTSDSNEARVLGGGIISGSKRSDAVEESLLSVIGDEFPYKM
ncbi:tRNA 2-thiouridylase [Candidatus Liberibacter asiaticus]|uniref:tRNA-specific 2-thiouridylase MnmA n=3 Tax=Liberibacter asiaticus TaxID=34021 RepID=C6XH79_LIBAP|nr:tRNA-specific 2-thiouridylase MnmA [Candidatus Liberibacter asiaticus str. psy62]AGH16392.1 tRNA-specific 2-thiouridylase MnmA [Candidatus Liberibacter asiaticus str. gxpsy]ALK06813.1 tRNA 2-thiouridine(34) synthase MnmA [Candidatus Liberibacter asiaticus]BAH96832.1 tRNA(5-methylaminomethyl-2-thiouridylate)- methyltransferase [Candidatus Liberibacter asiaticus str. Ishi-1]ASK52278.1 tRNA 2-thiouridine(34) synthase MnmA [Candidatus Liberibacter asiaticus]